MKLIAKDITSKILIVGVDASKDAKGGMASVIQSYKKYFATVNYITTWKDKSKIIKILVFVKAIFIYILKLTTNKNIKVVHIHSTVDASFKRKSLFVKIAKFFKKRILLHMHGGAFPAYYENQSDNKKKSILSILNSVDIIAVIIDNPWLRWFRSIGVPEEKIVVLQNTIEKPTRKELPYSCENIRMIFMGKLLKEKGIYDLLDVIKDHKNELSEEFKLKIAGFFDDKKLIQTIADYNIENIVSFEGFLSGDDKKELLAWGNVLIQPSYFEAQSISILEGMSYGLAILASNVGGIPSIVHNNVNGLLFTPGNKEEIWMAIKKIIDDPSKIRSFGIKSAKMVSEYYPKQTIGKLRCEYLKLLK